MHNNKPESSYAPLRASLIGLGLLAERTKKAHRTTVRMAGLSPGRQEKHQIVAMDASQFDPRFFFEQVALDRIGHHHAHAPLPGGSLILQAMQFGRQRLDLAAIFLFRLESAVAVDGVPQKIARSRSRQCIEHERNQDGAETTANDHAPKSPGAGERCVNACGETRKRQHVWPFDPRLNPREGENMSPLPPSDTAILLVAAGRGARAGQDRPKQHVRLAGRPLLSHALDAMAVLERPIQVVIAQGEDEAFLAAAEAAGAATRALLRPPVIGGATRQASVRAGLEALGATHPPGRVLIHDAARAFAGPALMMRAAMAAGDAMVPALPLTDTIRRLDGAGSAVIDRTPLRAIQTPQVFAFGLILAAHRRAAEAGLADFTDDSAVAEWAGHKIGFFEGDAENMKVTRPEDFAIAEARLLAGLPDLRSAQGYDVHAFGPGDHVWLGGVRIPHTHGLVGHSDADVLMHAITDALLGALADGDIGSHFPPSDPQWKGASSDIFLRHAMALLRARGGMVAHLDGTLICEAPKVGPHRETIRARLAEICDIPLDRIAVKATTSEGLGFTGRREGIAAMAMATIRLPLARRPDGPDT